MNEVLELSGVYWTLKMKRNSEKVALCGALIALVGIVLAGAFLFRAPDRAVDIHLTNGRAPRGGWVVTGTISNLSKCPVEYVYGPFFAIATLSNGMWETNWSLKSVTGTEELAPGTACRPFDVSEYIPDRATAARVGVEVTSLSPLSRLGLRMIGTNNRVLSWVGRWLTYPDARWRSTTTWSQSLYLTSSNEVVTPRL